jgi:hypothetical protein
MESANEKGYTEKGADTWNQPIKKGKKNTKKGKKRKGKKKTKKEKEKEKEKTHVQ